MTDLDPALHAMLEAAVRGEYTDIDFRYDGSTFMPDLAALAALGLVTVSYGDQSTSPYLASCHATELAVGSCAAAAEVATSGGRIEHPRDMPDPFDVWCDARASADRRVAWSSLAKRELEGVPFAGARTSRSSAAELAAAWFVRPLDSFRWLVHHHFAFHRAEMPRPPVDDARHPATDAFVEGLVDVRETCFESVATRGVSDGSRLVRSDEVDVSIHDGSRDGVGVAATVIRIADRDRRVDVSIPVGVNVAFVVAEDPARLDELEALARPHLRHGDVSYADSCVPGASDRDATLAWFAQRAAVIDPAFTDAVRWDVRDVPGSPSGVTRVRARDGSRSIELATHGLGPPGAASTLRFDLHESGLVGARRLDASIRASTEHRWPAMVFAEVDEPVYLALTRLATPP